LKKRLAAREPKNFFESGPWALALSKPVVQSKRSFFASFCSQKEVLASLPTAPALLPTSLAGLASR
jgi:hypothetical protein